MSKRFNPLFLLSMVSCALLFTNTSYASLDEAIEQFNKGEHKTATELFKNTNANLEETAIADSFLGRIAFQNKDSKQAEKLVNKALKSAPNAARVHANYGIIMAALAQQASIFKKLGYAKKSLAGFKQASELEPENIAYHQNLMGYYLGAPSIAGGDNELALKEAEAIGKLDNKQGISARLGVYQATDNTTAIAQMFKSLPDELKRDPDILFFKGLYFQTSENYKQAVEKFSLSIQHAGEDKAFQASKYGALYQIGRTSVLSEDNIENGMASLQEYIQTAPTLNGLPSKNWAKFRLANLLEMNGQQAEAKEKLSFLEKNVTDENLKKAIQKAL